MLNNIRENLKAIKVDTIISTILLLIMAIMFLVNPESAMISATIVFSSFILVDGIESLFIYFFTNGPSVFFWHYFIRISV